MTDQIHRIADKEPEFWPCFMWHIASKRWTRITGGMSLAWYAKNYSHWSDSPTAPEVRPEETKRVHQEVDLEIGETVSGNINFNMIGGQNITVDRAFAGRVRDRLTYLLRVDSPASTPSPAAIAAAREIHQMEGRAERGKEIIDRTAAIIDKHFAAKEGGMA